MHAERTIANALSRSSGSVHAEHTFPKTLGPIEAYGAHMGAYGAPMGRPWHSMGGPWRPCGAHAAPMGAHGHPWEDPWGAHGDPLRAGQGGREHYINKLPINRTSGRYVKMCIQCFNNVKEIL